ncbi:hypothetical protein [Dactylosporangium sp. CA-139066]|uniref:hypothetical protein n=1 Tax=Dactylosporangium sp. CA-139066 TaxID=3239930 RepID=UPI003D8FCD18
MPAVCRFDVRDRGPGRGVPDGHPSLPPKDKWMTQAGAVAAYRLNADGYPTCGLTAAQASALPAAAKRTTMGAFNAAQGIAPIVKDVYTDVYDVATGELILKAIGVDVVA